MLDNSIKLIYQLIESKFGITQDEIAEIDLKDGKQDGRINGISLFHYFENGTVNHKMPKEQIMNQISLFLSDTESVDIEYFSKSTPIEYKAVNLSKSISSDDIVKQLINEIHKIGFANLDKPISQINENNVIEVLDKYQKMSDKKNSMFGKVYDHESLFEAILDESISDEKKKKYINHIKNALVKRINDLNGDANFTGKLFSLALDSAIKKWWPFQNSEKLEQLCNSFIKIIKQLETMQETGEKITPAKAKKINKGFIEILKWMGISTDDLLGNGYFDNDSIQMTGNCWIHSGINSMVSNPASKEYLNNLISKTPNGNTVVYLPGAKYKGLPKPKGDGIFVYTQKQISKAVQEESAGDGEFAAINLAIRDARRAETKNPKETTSGGSFEEFCKWIYGNEAETQALSWGGLLNDNDKKEMANNARNILNIFDSIYLKDEISEDAKSAAELAKWQANYDSPEKMAQKLKEIFNSKNYIINVSLTDKVYDSMLKGKPLIPDKNSTTHAVTIIGIDGNNVYIKDSNNPKIPLKIDILDLVKCCPIQVCKID